MKWYNFLLGALMWYGIFTLVSCGSLEHSCTMDEWLVRSDCK